MDEGVRKALELFDLRMPFTQAQLDAKRQELMTTWHPHRYANLTNNPRKYMEMYKKGEAKTKEIAAAYELLLRTLRG